MSDSILSERKPPSPDQQQDAATGSDSSPEGLSKTKPRKVSWLFKLQTRFIILILLFTLTPVGIFAILTRANLQLALLIGGMTTAFAILISQLLSAPIRRLTQVAEEVTAGNLEIQAPVQRFDEIGMLANVFNEMTQQLRQHVSELEQRIGERTTELAQVSEQMKHRVHQLQTVAEAAHAIASVRDPDQILNQIAQLISERFGFYHVGIFLLNKSGEYAILQAANSEGGKKMLARSHQLKVGQTSIVGHVTHQGEPRIVLDVGEDAAYFNNPDLPLTRSEMAWPLKTGDQVIGALDVQSTKPQAFMDEDIEIFKILADQVTIAIENAKLLEETRRSLAEMRALHSQYLRQEWSRLTAQQRLYGFEYRHGKIFPIQETSSNNGKAAGKHPDQPVAAMLSVPISIRGQVIGMLNFEQTDPAREWSPEDIGLVEGVADQVGIALENTRLLEEVQRQATREQKINQISTQVRSSVHIETILQNTVRELGKAMGATRTYIQINKPG